MAWMIYGAYGYTGRLVTALAAERGELPVLAGRDERRLSKLGQIFELEHRSFDLADPAAVVHALDGIDVVAHCAGPFSATAMPMVQGCLDSATHYLDITGEIEVFEAILARDKEAQEAGVALIPGSGFDVVPTDCLAALLAQKLPDATRLNIAFRMDGGVSPGTAKTAMESLGASARGRVDGVIAPVPAVLRRRTVEFADGRSRVTALSWGDVSTAFHSTGICDITVYAAVPPTMMPLVALSEMAGPATRNRLVQGALKRAAARLPGPSAKAREESRGQVWAEVSDDKGVTLSGTASTLNGYDLTADAVVRIAKRLVAGTVEPGAHTPSGALGAEFVRELDGIEVRVPQ